MTMQQQYFPGFGDPPPPTIKRQHRGRFWIEMLVGGDWQFVRTCRGLERALRMALCWTQRGQEFRVVSEEGIILSPAMLYLYFPGTGQFQDRSHYEN